MASAVRMVSWQAATPADTAMISVAMPFSFSRIAYSTAISSNVFIDILTPAVSTADPSDFTRTFTL
jgi:Mg/Co/Ni transporter MgtE